MRYLHAYDASGNRTGEQIDTAPVGANYNRLNQLTNQIGNGMTQFSGNISKTGAVSVAGNSASMTNQTNFSQLVTTQPGTNTVSITAQDLNGNQSVSNYQVILTNNSVVRTLIYDLNGNLLTNSATTGTNTYEWDALNRLVAVNEAGTNRSEFYYDGVGHRSAIVELTNGVAYSTKTFLWCGTELCEERDSTGTNVTKRFFAQGEQINGTNYYFTKDHLGSVREMTDSAGVIHARYDYDPYGRITKVSGDQNADFGFTGHYLHYASGLFLTYYRAYDPNTGRWISRDPSGEESGINLYAYVSNDPVNSFDILGLVEDWSDNWHHNALQNLKDYFTKSGINIDDPKWGHILPSGVHNEMHARGFAEAVEAHLFPDGNFVKSSPKQFEKFLEKELKQMDEFKDLFNLEQPATMSYGAWRNLSAGIGLLGAVAALASASASAETIACDMKQFAIDSNKGDDAWAYVDALNVRAELNQQALFSGDVAMRAMLKKH